MALYRVKWRLVIPRHGDDFGYFCLTHGTDLIHHCALSSAGHARSIGLHLNLMGGFHEKNNAPRLR